MDLFFKYLEFEKRFSPHTLTSYRTDLGQFSDYLTQTYQITDAAEAGHAIIRSWIMTLVQKELETGPLTGKLPASAPTTNFCSATAALPKTRC